MSDGFESVVGQRAAVEQLRAAAKQPSHAYMFVGPRGSGKRAAAAAFAGEVLAAGTEGAAADRIRDLARREQHPDVFVHTPQGTVLTIKEDVPELVREAFRSPIESDTKVVVCDRLETASDVASAALLKSVEEPPPTAMFILLTEAIPSDHVALASRCVRIDFPSVSTADIVSALVADGVDPAVANELASAAGGNIDRARLLGADPEFLARRNAWQAVASQLDGSGGRAAALVDELRSMIDLASEPLAEKHKLELDAMAEREEQLGTRGSGRKMLDVRQKREIRLLRTDEIRLGFSTLAAQYHEGLATAPNVTARIAAIKRIDQAADALKRNPNEALLLQSLFLSLPSLP